jgi:hypothetical protein
MNVRMLVAAAVILAMSIGQAFAWGADGHQVVGSIADQLLNPRAKAEVNRILGFELRAAGPWADCVRSVVKNSDGTFTYVRSNVPEFHIPCIPFETPEETRRMEGYAARNWNACVYQDGKKGCQDTYHFADVAVQHNRYDRAFAGTSNHDIVSAINAAILVLKDQPAPSPLSIRDKKEALFLLAHFLGDLHQPLHVGAVYLDANGQLLNPDQSGSVDPNTETAGGNFIFDQGKKLHSEWDAIPADLGNSADAIMVAKARTVTDTPGPVENFAVTWASDTVRASHSAFAGMTFTRTGNQHWLAHFDDATRYLENQDRLKRAQLAKGGARLAQLLNAIWLPILDVVTANVSTSAAATAKVTACTVINLCYCINADKRDAIAGNVARVRQLIADQKALGKAIGYLSIPLSTAGGSYFGVNQDVANKAKERIEKRFGANSAWILNPGAEGNLPSGASGADYMYMWTQILEGRNGLGEDFDFFYFTGPADFSKFLSLTGEGDMETIGAYFDQRLASDAGLKKAVEQGQVTRASFRNYYALRASVAFSFGSHDEWNISHVINERRRGANEFGIAGQIPLLFEGQAVTPSNFEGTVAAGDVGRCVN